MSNQKKVIDIQKRTFRVGSKKSLKTRAKAKGIIYGSFPEIYQIEFERDRNLQSSLIRECAMLTVGCYWNRTRPSLETFDFTDSDYFVRFASKNKMLVRGHPLVWHEALPTWLSSTLNSGNAEQILARHIQTTVSRYAGKMHSWDVVNEAIDVGKDRAAGEPGASGLRQSPWLEFLGMDYIDLAFRLAAKADAKAKLVYNEYGVEYDRPEDEAKRQAVLNLLQRLKSKGTPIYALGIQSHLLGDLDNYHLDKFREFINNVASLGLKIMITEMDVSDDKLSQDIKQRDRIIAGAYEDYLSIVLAQKAVVSVTTWGLSDRYTWLSWKRPRPDKSHVRPLPFDRDMKPKLAWNAIARAFDRAPKR
ncbi:endo-1,4-beta-xylanase [Chamaesiphon sp. OTE_75_metabat_556]|uniref:endo-1,4-beta-xylanase n=1 Tax=Chamaesiphon sp. OTE_75_metabat_556 TaxID=2964692 RepID=UPI00286C5EF2|nr:endo-1,4-beta-xylanase [Chamaesiphon sp. OTE_75_metabat_556]